VLAEPDTPTTTAGAGDGRGARQPAGEGKQGAAELFPHISIGDAPVRRGDEDGSGPGSRLMARPRTHEGAAAPAPRPQQHGNMVDMNLVSLIDVFTILIFFLLSSAAGRGILVSPKAVNLPVANAEKAPEADRGAGGQRRRDPGRGPAHRQREPGDGRHRMT
jgi:hypothetical protein